jgi:cytochrome c oxidase subunit 1
MKEMKYFSNRPHILIFLLIIIVILLGLTFRNSIIDINVHDTYYVIDFLTIAILIAMVLGIIGFLGWILKKKLK